MNKNIKLARWCYLIKNKRYLIISLVSLIIMFCMIYKIEISYSDIDKFKYFAKNNNIVILNEEYLENVILQIGIKDKELLKDISENEINVRNIQFLKEMYMWKRRIFTAFL